MIAHTDWVDGYRRAVATHIINNGSFVGDKDHPHAGRGRVVAQDAAVAHLNTDPFTIARLTNATWVPLGRDETGRGFIAVVTCACGEYNEAEFRWDGTLGVILQELLTN